MILILVFFGEDCAVADPSLLLLSLSEILLDDETPFLMKEYAADLERRLCTSRGSVTL